MPTEFSDKEIELLVPITKLDTKTQQAKGSDVFLRYGQKTVLYSASTTHDKLGLDHLEHLVAARAGEVFVKRTNKTQTMNSLSQYLAKTLSDPELSIEKKFCAVYYGTAQALEMAADLGYEADSMDALLGLLDTATPFIIDSLSNISHLFELLSSDYSTFYHSISVFTYSIAIAGYQGIRDHELLRNLGFGAILHDIGKTQISREILEKPGPLTRGEWREMMKHPQYGVQLLANAGLPQTAIEIVAQHHEKADGTGYPQGLTEDRTDPLTGIVAVSDIYDALTKDRPYRPAYPPFKALSLMRETMSKQIDLDAFRTLVLLHGGQPQIEK